MSDYIQHTRPDGSTFYSNILKEIKSTASLPKQCGDVKQILNEPSKEATDHAHDICNKLHGSLKYWAETSIFVQLAINASTAPLEQRIKELESSGDSFIESALEFIVYTTQLEQRIKELELQHNPMCDALEVNPDGIKKPCNCILQQLTTQQKTITELESQLAMAIDAANKGDLARQTAGGMEMQIAEQQKALEFYGDEKNYNYDESLNDGYPLAGTQPVIKDYGAIARAAMGKEK